MPLHIVLLLVSAFTSGVILPENPGHILAPLPGYLVVTLLPYLGVFGVLLLERWGGQQKIRNQTIVVAIVWGIIICIFARQQAIARQHIPLPGYANDSVVQSVEAGKAFVAGHNPYTTDFSTTPFGVYPSPVHDGGPNVAAQHYAYQPLVFLSYVPLILVHNITGWNIDFQSLAVLWFAGIILVLSYRQSWLNRMYLVLCTVAQPLLWIYAVSGFNDWLMIFLLVASALAMHQRRVMLAAICFGLALATKQTAWLLVPLWVWWGWSLWSTNRPTFRRYVITLGMTAMVIIGPFILWNPAAWYDDTIRFVSGAMPRTFPISGITLMQLLRYLPGWSDAWRPASFWPVQLGVLLPTGWFLWRWLRGRVTTTRILMASCIVLFITTLTNRVGAPNYFLAPLVLGLAAYMTNQLPLSSTTGDGPSHHA
jgi:hypothetical protein